MHVAILIVAYRNAEDVRKCVQALAHSTYRDFAIHICENGGAEAFEELGRRVTADLIDRPLNLILSPGNVGFAGGNNLLARQLDAPWDALWILNPDTEPQPGALAAMIERLSLPGYGIIGSRLVNPDSGRVQLYAGRWRKWRADGFNIGLGAPIEAVPDTAAIEAEMTYVNGASMLVSRAFVEARGLMTEDYFLYCEEVEWCLRRGEFRLGYAHDALIYHAHGSTIGSNLNRKLQSPLSTYLARRNGLLLTRRIYPAALPITAAILFALNFRLAAAGAWRNFFVAMRGWRDGVRGLSGPPTQRQMLGRD